MKIKSLLREHFVSLVDCLLTVEDYMIVVGRIVKPSKYGPWGGGGVI